MQISWARTRPIGSGLPERVLFESDTIRVIEEASRMFREFAPLEDYEVAGFVLASERGVTEPEGNIRLDAFIDGKMHRVTVQLGSADYSVALRAHDERGFVTCTGDLIKQGRGYRLENPHQFKVLSTDQS